MYLFFTMFILLDASLRKMYQISMWVLHVTIMKRIFVGLSILLIIVCRISSWLRHRLALLDTWFSFLQILNLQRVMCVKDMYRFVICHIVRYGNVNSIQNPSTVINPTMKPYCILLPLTLPCRTTWHITNSLISAFTSLPTSYCTDSYLVTSPVGSSLNSVINSYHMHG